MASVSDADRSSDTLSLQSTFITALTEENPGSKQPASSATADMVAEDASKLERSIRYAVNARYGGDLTLE